MDYKGINMADLVSIIVPVYKTEKYLIRCVESIINQTYNNIEVILVDDGSPDNSPQMCDELSKKYANVQVIHKTNGGASSARNAGIECASGKYISFVDSDDYIDKYMIERLIFVAHKHFADVTMLKYKEVTCGPPQPSVNNMQEIVYTGSEINKAFLKLKIDSACVGLYKKQIINPHRFMVGKTSEDILFNFEVFKSIKKFVYLPERRYYYYNNPDSVSNGPLDLNMLNYLNVRKLIYKYYAESKDYENMELAESLYARAAFGLLLRLALYGNTKDLDSSSCRRVLQRIFRKHKQAFYKEESIPLSRKMIALVLDYFFPVIKLTKRLI